MDFIFNKFSDIGLRRLYKFVLKRTIGKYLKDELLIEQLEVNSQDGIIELKNLEIDANYFNDEYLVSSPINIHSIFISSLKVYIKIQSLLTESLRFEIDELSIVLEPKNQKSQSSSTNPKSIDSTQSTSIPNQIETEGDGNYIEESDDENSPGDEGQKSLAFIANWIEIIVAKLQVSLNKMSIKILSRDESFIQATFKDISYFNTDPNAFQEASESSIALSEKVTYGKNSSVFMKKLGASKLLKISSLDLILKDKKGTENSILQNQSTMELRIKVDHDPVSSSSGIDVDVYSPSLLISVEISILFAIVEILSLYSPESFSKSLKKSGNQTPNPLEAAFQRLLEVDPTMQALRWMEKGQFSEKKIDSKMPLDNVDFDKVLYLMKKYQHAKEFMDGLAEDSAAAPRFSNLFSNEFKKSRSLDAVSEDISLDANSLGCLSDEISSERGDSKDDDESAMSFFDTNEKSSVLKVNLNQSQMEDPLKQSIFGRDSALYFSATNQSHMKSRFSGRRASKKFFKFRFHVAQLDLYLRRQDANDYDDYLFIQVREAVINSSSYLYDSSPGFYQPSQMNSSRSGRFSSHQAPSKINSNIKLSSDASISLNQVKLYCKNSLKQQSFPEDPELVSFELDSPDSPDLLLLLDFSPIKNARKIFHSPHFHFNMNFESFHSHLDTEKNIWVTPKPKITMNINLEPVRASVFINVIEKWADELSQLALLSVSAEPSSTNVNFQMSIPSLDAFVHSDPRVPSFVWRNLLSVLEFSDYLPAAWKHLGSYNTSFPPNSSLTSKPPLHTRAEQISRSLDSLDLLPHLSQSKCGFHIEFVEVSVNLDSESSGGKSPMLYQSVEMKESLLSIFINREDTTRSSYFEFLMGKATSSLDEFTHKVSFKKLNSAESHEYLSNLQQESDEELGPAMLTSASQTFISIDAFQIDLTIRQIEYNALMIIADSILLKPCISYSIDDIDPKYRPDIASLDHSNTKKSKPTFDFALLLSSKYAILTLSEVNDSITKTFVENFTSRLGLDLPFKTTDDLHSDPSSLRIDEDLPISLCVSIIDPKIDIASVQANLYFGIRANDLKMYEMSNEEYLELRESRFDFHKPIGRASRTGEQKHLIPFIHRASIVKSKEISSSSSATHQTASGGMKASSSSLLGDNSSYGPAFEVKLALISSQLQSSMKEVQFFIDFHDIMISHDPSSTWLLKVVNIFTPHTSKQMAERKKIELFDLIANQYDIKSHMSLLNDAIEHLFDTEDESLDDPDNEGSSSLNTSSVTLNDEVTSRRTRSLPVRTASKELPFEVTKILVRVRDCLIEYSCAQSQSRSLVFINFLTMTSNIVSNSPRFSLKFKLSGLSLYLSNHLPSDSIRSYTTEALDRFESIDLKTFLDSNKFILLLSLDHLDNLVTLNGTDLEALLIKIDIGMCKISTCLDSLDLFAINLVAWFKEFEVACAKSEKIMENNKRIKSKFRDVAEETRHMFDDDFKEIEKVKIFDMEAQKETQLAEMILKAMAPPPGTRFDDVSHIIKSDTGISTQKELPIHPKNVVLAPNSEEDQAQQLPSSKRLSMGMDHLIREDYLGYNDKPGKEDLLSSSTSPRDRLVDALWVADYDYDTFNETGNMLSHSDSSQLYQGMDLNSLIRNPDVYSNPATQNKSNPQRATIFELEDESLNQKDEESTPNNEEDTEALLKSKLYASYISQTKPTPDESSFFAKIPFLGSKVDSTATRITDVELDDLAVIHKEPHDVDSSLDSNHPMDVAVEVTTHKLSNTSSSNPRFEIFDDINSLAQSALLDSKSTYFHEPSIQVEAPEGLPRNELSKDGTSDSLWFNSDKVLKVEDEQDFETEEQDVDEPDGGNLNSLSKLSIQSGEQRTSNSKAPSLISDEVAANVSDQPFPLPDSQSLPELSIDNPIHLQNKLSDFSNEVDIEEGYFSGSIDNPEYNIDADFEPDEYYMDMKFKVIDEMHKVFDKVFDSLHGSLSPNTARPLQPLSTDALDDRFSFSMAHKSQPSNIEIKDTKQKYLEPKDQTAYWYNQETSPKVNPHYIPLYSQVDDLDDLRPAEEKNLKSKIVVKVRGNFKMRLYDGFDWEELDVCKSEFKEVEPKSHGETTKPVSAMKETEKRQSALPKKRVSIKDPTTLNELIASKPSRNSRGRKQPLFQESGQIHSRRLALPKPRLARVPREQRDQMDMFAKELYFCLRYYDDPQQQVNQVDGSAEEEVTKDVWEEEPSHLKSFSNLPVSHDMASQGPSSNLLAGARQTILPSQRFLLSAQDLLISFGRLGHRRRKVIGSWTSLYRPKDLYLPIIQLSLVGYDNSEHIFFHEESTQIEADSSKQPNLSSTPLESTMPSSSVPMESFGQNRREIVEYRLYMKLLPVRCYFEDNIISYIRHLTGITQSIQKEKNKKTSSSNKHQEIPIAGSSQVQRTTPKEPYFQLVSIAPIQLKINYRASIVNFQALHAGDYTQLLNIFPLEGLELTLKALKFNGVTGTESCLHKILEAWIKDIYKNQLLNVITGAAPFKGLSNIGSELRDLIILPAKRSGGKSSGVVREIQKGTKSFLQTFTRETLNASHKLSMLLAKAITELVSDNNDSNTPHSKTRHPRQSTSNREENLKHGLNVSASQSVQINSQESLRYRQPKNISEGLDKAYSAISREVGSAMETIIAIPMKQYERSGPKGYWKAVVKAVPIAVLKPIAGLAEGLSYTILGIRNVIDPASRYEDEDIWDVEMNSPEDLDFNLDS